MYAVGIAVLMGNAHFQLITTFPPSQKTTNAPFSACFRINLQLQIAPAKFPRLSSLALNPKWSAKNHHNVRWSASGLWQPKVSLSNNFSSSSPVNSRQSFGLFPRPCFTRFFLLAANTSLERQNSSSLRILRQL